MSEIWCCVCIGLTCSVIWLCCMRLGWMAMSVEDLVLPPFLSRFIRDCLEEIRNPTPLRPPQDRDFIRFGPKLPADDKDLYDQEATAKDD